MKERRYRRHKRRCKKGNDIEREKRRNRIERLRSQFFIVDRAICPRIFLGSLRALPLVHDHMQDLATLEIVASQAATTSYKNKKEEFATPDKLRRKCRHMSPTIFLHIRRDMFFPVHSRIFLLSHLPPRSRHAMPLWIYIVTHIIYYAIC